jgi:transposase-like protein
MCLSNYLDGREGNWESITVFSEFPFEIRKIIYAANLIENLNGKSENTLKISFHSQYVFNQYLTIFKKGFRFN